jgi:hypothetical protein
MSGVVGPRLVMIPTANLFAYSFRKVVPTATVSCRVRRSSDNTEQDIGFVGNDLDTSSLTSFVGTNDGWVVKIYEQNGTGKDVLQTSAASQFKIVNAGTIYTLNGKPTCVTNNGDYLLNSTGMFNFVNTVGTSIFSVTQPISHLGGGFSVDFLFSIGNGGLAASNRLFQNTISGGAGNPTSYISNVQLISITQSYSGGIKLQSSIFKTGSHKYYINNSLVGTDTSTLVNISNNRLVINSVSWTPGSTAFANQYFSELLVYNSDETSNQTTIQNNINSYYSIY